MENNFLNSKGTYSALIGLMLFVLITSVAFIVIANVNSYDLAIIPSKSMEVRKEADNLRLVLDKAAGQAMAEQTVTAFESRECSSDPILISDYSDSINSKFSELTSYISARTGLQCSAGVLPSVTDNSRFSVTLKCLFEDAEAGKRIQGYEHVNVFELQKDVDISFTGTSPIQMTVNVIDADSGLLDASESAECS